MKKKSKPKKPLPKKAVKKAPAKAETPEVKTPEEPKAPAAPAAPEVKAPEKKSALPTFPADVELKNILLFEGRLGPFQVGEKVYKHILDFMCGRWYWDEALYGAYVPEELRKGYVLLSRGWGDSPTEGWRDHLSKTAVERGSRRSDGSLPSWMMDSLKVMTIEQFKEWFNKMLDLKQSQ
jgi:hypothetical protein